MERSDAKLLAKHGQLKNIPRAALQVVAPPLAAEWLERSRRNRKISQEHVTRLADQMRAGEWQTTHQGIAFDCNGYLIDGHHTLWAVLLSGTPVELMVTSNLRPEAIRVIDTGKNRTLQDRLTLSGTWGQVTRAEAACLKRMMRGRSRTRRRSPSDEYSDWKANAAHVRFAINLTDDLGPRLRLAAIRAVIARAHAGAVPPDVVQRFCLSLKTQLLDQLRGLSDRDTYDCVERALWSFTHDGKDDMPTGGFV